MSNGVSRREFVKYSLATGALLAAGDNLLNNMMARAATGITEVDRLTVWVLTDNYYDTLRPDVKNTKRFRAKAGKSMHAEHGLAFYLETQVAGKTSTCMYDFGLDPVGVLNNIGLLRIEVGKTTAFSLSHGHWNHCASAVNILK